MEYKELKTDLDNLRSGSVPPSQINTVVNETINYIEYLEGLKVRLTKFEETTNKIASSEIANKEQFLEQYKEFLTS